MSLQSEQKQPALNSIKYAEFHSLNSRTTWLVTMLIIFILISILSIQADISQLNLVQRIIDGDFVSESDAAANDSRAQMLAVAQFIVLITISVIYLFWKNRAYKNLDSLKAFRREYSSGWAVGAYFVPFLNLFKPFQIMREIWKGSDPGYIDNDSESGTNWKAAPSNILLPVWWIIFLIDSVLGNISYRMSNNFNTLQQIQNYSIVNLVSDTFGIFSAITLIILARKLNQRQENKYQRIELSGNINTPLDFSMGS